MGFNVERTYESEGKIKREKYAIGSKNQIKTTKNSKTTKDSKKTKIKSRQQKILRKPRVKGPTPISSLKTLKSFAQTSEPLVREVAPKELVKDERSLFFKKEYEKEGSKWLS